MLLGCFVACFVGSLAPLGAFARLLAPQEALPTAWRRRPAPFAFEGIQPHLEPNRASGKVSAGAIRLGHFYVVADLFLRLHQYGPPFFPPTPLCRVCAAVASEVPLHHVPPFQAYAVEGWWLDNLLKGGKLTRQTYLTTVGFQKRLGDCKAAERFLREEVVRDKPHI